MSPDFKNGFDVPDDQKERHYDVFEEVALIIPYLRKQGVRAAISSQVRLARRRFGHYEVIDFLAVLFGYEILGERTLETFYEVLGPLAQPFMALFDRERLPSRSALSRFLASLTWGATEALRTLFLADLLARPLDKERHTGQLVDRVGNTRVVFDIDGTREAARQRARPQTEELPSPQRRLNKVCAAFLHRAQTWGGRAYSHRRLAGP